MPSSAILNAQLYSAEIIGFHSVPIIIQVPGGRVILPTIVSTPWAATTVLIVPFTTVPTAFTLAVMLLILFAKLLFCEDWSRDANNIKMLTGAERLLFLYPEDREKERKKL